MAVDAYGNPTRWFDERGRVRRVVTDLMRLEVERFGEPVELREPDDLLVDSEVQRIEPTTP